MKGWLQDQFDFLKNAATRAHPGANPAGMAQTIFENKADMIWDDIIGPAGRIGAKVALIGGAIAGANWLIQNNDALGGHGGGAAGGAIIGGIAGAAGMSALSGARIRQLVAGKGLANAGWAGKAIHAGGFAGGVGKAAMRFGHPLLGLAGGAIVIGIDRARYMDMTKTYISQH